MITEEAIALRARMNDLEDAFYDLSVLTLRLTAVVVWGLLAAAVYFLWKSGVINLELFHG